MSVAMTDYDLRHAVESFLFREADLLDSWALDEWLTLFDEEATYEVPPTDKHDGDRRDTLFIIADDMQVLRGRVERLKSPQAYAENPHSRTRRFISNIQIRGREGDRLVVTANFMVTRIRKGSTDTFVGRYEHTLSPGGDAGFRIRRRRAFLDHDALRPHGRVSIIL
jgi:p-cumate 2,3-dioxygenase beta subunit